MLLLLLLRPAPQDELPARRLAAGTGWRVLRRLSLQEDILIRSRLRQPSATAGGRTRAPPSTPPLGPGGARNRDGGSRNWSPAPGGREGPKPLRALLPLAKVNQTLPRSGGARRVRLAAGGEGPEEGVPGGAQPGWGRAWPQRSLPALFLGRCWEIPGRWGGWDEGAGPESGTQAAGSDLVGRKRRLIRAFLC